MNKSNKRTPKEIRGCIVGTLLGDSWITGKQQFGCEQVNLPLINLKAKILEHYLGSVKIRIRPRLERKIVIEGREITSNVTYMIAAHHSRFAHYKKLFYRTGSKQVTQSILQFLTPEGIALWVMDDGYMDFKKSSSTRNLRICTDSYDEISHKEMIKYFQNVWGIESKIYWHKRNKFAEPKPRLSFNATNTQKIISLIYPYILDDFLYKIDMQYTQEALRSKRCSSDYLKAVEYISQRREVINIYGGTRRSANIDNLRYSLAPTAM